MAGVFGGGLFFFWRSFLGSHFWVYFFVHFCSLTDLPRIFTIAFCLFVAVCFGTFEARVRIDTCPNALFTKLLDLSIAS